MLFHHKLAPRKHWYSIYQSAESVLTEKMVTQMLKTQQSHWFNTGQRSLTYILHQPQHHNTLSMINTQIKSQDILFSSTSFNWFFYGLQLLLYCFFIASVHSIVFFFYFFFFLHPKITLTNTNTINTSYNIQHITK